MKEMTVNSTRPLGDRLHLGGVVVVVVVGSGRKIDRRPTEQCFVTANLILNGEYHLQRLTVKRTNKVRRIVKANPLQTDPSNSELFWGQLEHM